jgi:hypothetical protein
MTNLDNHDLKNIFILGIKNRENLPFVADTTKSIFDYDVDSYTLQNTVRINQDSLLLGLVSKCKMMSNQIMIDTNNMPDYIVTNTNIASKLTLLSNTHVPLNTSPGKPFHCGDISNIHVFCDPYMNYNDNRILVGYGDGTDNNEKNFIVMEIIDTYLIL